MPIPLAAVGLLKSKAFWYAILAVVVMLAVSYSVHLYNESVRETLRKTMQAQIDACVLERDKAVEANTSLRASVDKLRVDIKANTARIAELQQIGETALKARNAALAAAAGKEAQQRREIARLAALANAPQVNTKEGCDEAAANILRDVSSSVVR